MIFSLKFGLIFHLLLGWYFPWVPGWCFPSHLGWSLLSFLHWSFSSDPQWSSPVTLAWSCALCVHASVDLFPQTKGDLSLQTYHGHFLHTWGEVFPSKVKHKVIFSFTPSVIMLWVSLSSWGDTRETSGLRLILGADHYFKVLSFHALRECVMWYGWFGKTGVDQVSLSLVSHCDMLCGELSHCLSLCLIVKPEIDVSVWSLQCAHLGVIMLSYY